MPHQKQTSRWVRRHTLTTRVTHWIWATCLFFLLLSGLQIFNAHPILYLGDQSGFDFENAIFSIGALDGRGIVTFFGLHIETTGFLGQSDNTARAFPAWATMPSQIDLATGRVIHFFFAWVLVGILLVWVLGAVLSGHLRQDLVLRRADWKRLGRDLWQHLRLRFHRPKRYGPVQRLTYAAVLFGLFPLVILTGLAMSPGMNAAMPWLPDLLGGRQTARTLHFVAAFALLLFFLVHIAMVILAGPLNEMRAIVTGWYRADGVEVSK